MRFPLIAATVLSLAAGSRAGAQEAKRPPNVVVVFTDDHAYQAVSAYNHALKLNQTPNIDRLAKEGVRLDRCLVPNSICGPSRAVLLTGRYSHSNGFYNNTNSRFDGSQTTFPKLLQRAGYQTAIVGKWHLVSDPTGFDFWQILPGQGQYYNPPMNRMGERVVVPGYVTDVVTDVSLAWLARRDPNKPFLLMCQHKAPHREWSPAIRHLNHDSGRQYPEPDTLFDDYAGRGVAERTQDMTLAKSINALDMKFTDPPGLTPAQKTAWDAYYAPRNAAFKAANPQGRDLVRWRYNRYLHDYLGCVKAVDESVGRVLDYLDREKLADNTIVLYASDQGFYLGEHGWFDKRWIFEESVRTPCLVRWPGVARPGTSSERLTSLLDVAPTFLGAAGIAIPDGTHGRSLAGVLRGQPPADWRTSFYYHYYEYPGPHDVHRHFGVVTDRYKLVRFYEPGKEYWELFDRQTDPRELTSVYGRPEHAAAQRDLHAELDRLRRDLRVPEADPPEALILPKKKKN